MGSHFRFRSDMLEKNRAWFKLLKSKKIGVTNGNLNMELVP